MIRVFAADVSRLDIGECRRFVSPGRWRKAGAYLHESDQKLSLGAELLLNYGLRRLAPQIARPVEYFADVSGKPELTGSPLQFNLSHSGVYAVCAIADRPVGVDVEREAEMELDIARKFFHPDEYRRIAAHPNPTSRFFEYWVLKESYVKSVGLGFGLALNSFCVDLSAEPIRVVENGAIQPYALQSWRMGDHHIAVCRQSDAPLGRDILEAVDIRECIRL
jgi:4'-phosphopantetheinyl transferase